MDAAVLYKFAIVLHRSLCETFELEIWRKRVEKVSK